MTNDQQNIILWHKGGDWVKIEDLTVIVYGNETYRFCNTSCPYRFTPVPNKPVFDLGSNITIPMGYLNGNETVKLVTPHTMIYTGQVSL